jgi:hypothetical protein
MSEKIEKFRKYKNAFEIAVMDEDTVDYVGGFSDIVRLENDLLAHIIKMVDNRYNDIGRKEAVLLCKHKKDSIRYLAEKVMKNENFEVEDRTSIEL